MAAFDIRAVEARLLREQSGGAKGFLQAFQLVIGNDAAFVNWLFFLK